MTQLGLPPSGSELSLFIPSGMPPSMSTEGSMLLSAVPLRRHSDLLPLNASRVVLRLFHMHVSEPVWLARPAAYGSLTSRLHGALSRRTGLLH